MVGGFWDGGVVGYDVAGFNIRSCNVGLVFHSGLTLP
jgi:hypothetical protein